MHNPMDLTGRRILVTGASSGIGRACAVLLAELGAKVILLARNPARLEETRQLMERGDDHPMIPFDLAATERIGELAKIYDFKTNKVHGVVHAAGRTGFIPLSATSPGVLAEMLAVNFYSYGRDLPAALETVLLSRQGVLRGDFVHGLAGRLEGRAPPIARRRRRSMRRRARWRWSSSSDGSGSIQWSPRTSAHGPLTGPRTPASIRMRSSSRNSRSAWANRKMWRMRWPFY